MKDARMRRAVPYIPNILDAQRRKEYVPLVAADRIRTLPEEAGIPPKLEGDDGRAQSIIEVLIIAKKAGETIRAIQAVRHRLKRESTIVLLHNGMGVLSEIQECWNDRDRPNILEGFSTHGISKREEFSIDHWGRGMIHMAIAHRNDETDIFKYQSVKTVIFPHVINSRHVKSDLRLELLSRNEKYHSLIFIIEQLLSNKVLNGTLRAYTPNLYLIQLRRTVLQSIIHTLGTLQRCTNGEIIRNKINHGLIGKLISEICPALQQDPVICSSPKFLNHFSFHELYAQVRHMALATPSHINSTLQDIVGKREMELRYHSGYLLKFAREKGVKMPTWSILHYLIKAEASLEQTRHNEFTPVSEDGEVLDLPEWTYDVPEKYWKIERVVERGEVIKPEMFEELEQDPLEGDHEIVQETAVLEDQSTTEETTRTRHETPSLTRRLQWTSKLNPAPTKRQRTLVPIPHFGFESKKDRQVKRVLAAAMPTKQPRSKRHDEKESYFEGADESIWKETIRLTTGTEIDESSPLDTELATGPKTLNFLQRSKASLEHPTFAKDSPREFSSSEQSVPADETQNVTLDLQPAQVPTPNICNAVESPGTEAEVNIESGSTTELVGQLMIAKVDKIMEEGREGNSEGSPQTMERKETDNIPNTSEPDEPVKRTCGRPPGSIDKAWSKE